MLATGGHGSITQPRSVEALETKMSAAQTAFDTFISCKSALGNTVRTEEIPNCMHWKTNQLMTSFFSQIQFETISFTISFIGPRGPAVMQNASVIFVHASQEHQRSQAVHAWGNVEDTFSAQNMFACMHAGWDIHRFKFPWSQNYQIYMMISWMKYTCACALGLPSASPLRTKASILSVLI